MLYLLLGFSRNTTDRKNYSNIEDYWELVRKFNVVIFTNKVKDRIEEFARETKINSIFSPTSKAIFVIQEKSLIKGIVTFQAAPKLITNYNEPDKDEFAKRLLGYGIDKDKADDIVFAPVQITPITTKVKYRNNTTLTKIDDVTIHDELLKIAQSLQINKNPQSDTMPGELHNAIIASGSPIPKNTIYYGAPGTGKTHKLQTLIKEQYAEIQATKELFVAGKLKNLALWEVLALVLLNNNNATVPTIRDHEFIANKYAHLTKQQLQARIWAALQNRTKKDCKFVNTNLEKRSEPLVFNKTENSIWSVDKTILEEYRPDLIELHDAIKNYKTTAQTTKRCAMLTFHQSTAYEDFIEGIKPAISDKDTDTDENKDLKYIIKDGIFYEACEAAAQLAGYANLIVCLKDDVATRAQKMANAPKYAIFIDEINRANAAAVFGELITLIETDKRLGMEHEILDIKLPYSRREFGVPANLDIIGTMNTADRSVEALDTALRRRFAFVEMPPDPSALQDNTGKDIEVEGINLPALLTAINARIEWLKDSDHCIGHAYFMPLLNADDKPAELKNIFLNKILPLLKEYFYGEWGLIGKVLSPSFIKEQTNPFKGEKQAGKSIKLATFDHTEAFIAAVKSIL